MTVYACLLLLSALVACGPSIEDQIERMERGGDDRVRARQELLLAKAESIPPLLEALEDPRHAASRPEIVEVLVDLMMRLEDPRIATVLQQHLRDDPDSQVRARICFAVGLYRRPEFSAAYLHALQDSAAAVRSQALTALQRIDDKLSEAQTDSLTEAARRLLDDDDINTRVGAATIVARRTDVWLTEAHKEKLAGRIAAAESLYHEALSYSPESVKTKLGLGTLYLENGQEKRGTQVLRESGWLVDVPRVPAGPQIDGRLDDAVWDRAAKISPFVTLNFEDGAAVPSLHRTEAYALTTEEALYLAARCEDAHPESLIVQSRERDHEEEYLQDLVEFFIDPEFDFLDVAKITINSAGAVTDGLGANINRNYYDRAWSVDSEAAGHVGDDFWSIEYRVEFGQQPQLPKPAKGSRWGVDVQRSFRQEEWSSWTPEYPDEAPKNYGWFLFQ